MEHIISDYMTTKRLLTILMMMLCCMTIMAQTAFDNVYEGCKLAVSALDKGTGSQSEMREAARLLTDAKWVSFQLKKADGEGSLGKHLFFSEKSFTDMADNHKVKRKAKEYSEERAGDGVRLCTRVIKGGKTVAYSFNCAGNRTLRVGVVAEVNGLVNLKVRAKRKNSSTAPIERKEHSDEYKGAQSRQIDMPLGGGQYIITLEITNKSEKDRSFAIMAN